MNTFLLSVAVIMIVGSLSLFVAGLLFARPKPTAPQEYHTEKEDQIGKQMGWVVSGIVIVALIVFLPLIVQRLQIARLGALRSQLEAARADVERLGMDVTSTQRELTSARQAVSDAEARVVSLQQALSEERQRIVAAQTQIGQLQAALKRAQESQAPSARVEELNKQVASLQQELAAAERQNRALTAEVESLKSSAAAFQSLGPSLDLVTKYTAQPFVETAGNSSVKKAVLQAFLLKDQGVAFAWNGRDPGTGLDSFGFVKEVLQAGGVSNIVQVPNLAAATVLFRRADKPQVGDIIVYRGNLAMVYLGQARAIGMTPLGIAVQKIDVAPKPLYVLRVPYPSSR